MMEKDQGWYIKSKPIIISFLYNACFSVRVAHPLEGQAKC